MEIYWACLLLLFWGPFCVNSQDPLEPGTRIVGGHDVNITQVPYQVSLRAILSEKKLQHICGGSLVTYEWVLTATHCTRTVPSSRLLVVLGTTKLSSGGVHRRPKKIIEHDNYDKTYYTNDIALINIEKVNASAAIRPIPLSGEYIPGGVDVMVSGWGYIDTNKKQTDTLQAISLKTTPRNQCLKIFGRYRQTKYLGGDKDTVICIISKPGMGACQGDSGGPLVKGKKLVGIVSFGFCAVGKPIGYTRVSAYLDWIVKTIKK